MSLNVQSLLSKFSDLRELIIMMSSNNSQPDVLCLQEIWQVPHDVEINLPGYSKLIFKTRNNNVQGGGVGIFVKKGIKFSVSSTHSIFLERIFESIFIDLTFPNNYRCTVGSVYRPTNHPTLTQTSVFDVFMETFSNLLSSLSDSKTNFFIVGDFNLDVVNYSSNIRVSDYVDLLFSYGVLQIVTKPTRCTSNSATIIDHILTNTSQPCFKSVI
jgi:exonuclease III